MLTILQWTSASVIVLNLPFLQYWQEFQWTPANGVDVDLHPERLCIKAAEEICAVLAAYHSYLFSFPCDTIFPIVLSAAIVWQFMSEMEDHRGGVAAKEQLELCVRSLSTVSSCWKNAGKYHEKLVTGTPHRPAPARRRTNSNPARLRNHAVVYNVRIGVQQNSPFSRTWRHSCIAVRDCHGQFEFCMRHRQLLGGQDQWPALD